MPSNKRHIVLLTTYYPPIQSVAVNRMLAFAKYLNKQYFQLTVVTLSKSNVSSDSLEADVRVIRLANVHWVKRKATVPGESRLKHTLKTTWNFLLNKLNYPEYPGWQKSAYNKLLSLHSQLPIDGIISSYAPVETHLVALAFCKTYNSVKWLADFRDEMSGNPYLSQKVRTYFKSIEAQLNERVNAVSSVSEPIIENLKGLMPQVPHFLTIMNGYDHSYTFPYQFNPVFTITMAGTFYGASKPTTFFEGLERFCSRTGHKVKIRFVGTSKNFAIPDFIKSDVDFIERVTQDEALRFMAESDANLMVLPIVEWKGVYSGKLFDYLSVFKPIIAVVDTTDVAAKLIKKCNAGFVANFNQVHEIDQAIEEAYRLWEQHQELQTDKNYIQTLHRKNGVEKLNQLLINLFANEIVSSRT